jgi:hypothetical protein
MVDSNFANSSKSNVEWPRRHQPQAQHVQSNTGTPWFVQFCLGTALGLVVGAMCGAFLPDRLMGAGTLSKADFDGSGARNLTRQGTSPTPLSEIEEISATAKSTVEDHANVESTHSWDMD